MSFRSQIVSGFFWTAGLRIVSQLLSWAITIIVMRLLSPSDYGLLAMGTFFVGLVGLIGEAGLGAAVVQMRTLDTQLLRKVFAAVILINGTLFILQFTTAGLVAEIFEEPDLPPIIRVLGVQFLIGIFSVIPLALLNRSLAFKTLSVITLYGSVVGSLISLILASLGFGVWALVSTSLMTAAWTAAAANVAAPFLRKPDFSLTGLRTLFVFGGQLTGARILWFIYSQADVLIAGKLLGKELLGVYSVAMHLASMPVHKLAGIINQVAYPAFAEAQARPEAIPDYTLRALRILSFFVFPMLWGLASVAREVVAVVLGPTWTASVVALEILPLIMPVYLISAFLNTVMEGIGRAGVVFGNVLTAACIMPVAFVVGVRWGVYGLSLAWLFGFLLVFALNVCRMLPVLKLTARQLLASLWRPFVASVAMYVSVHLARYTWIVDQSPAMSLITLIAIGASIYSSVTAVTNWMGVREVVETLYTPSGRRMPRQGS